MVIAPSRVQFRQNQMAGYKIVRSRSRHKSDFRPKWHDTKTSYHFIILILKILKIKI